MKIKTQFIVTTFIFSLILLAAMIGLLITNQRVGQTNRQREIAATLQQGANELSYLSHDYLIYQEDQLLRRWESKFGSFSTDVARLKTGTPEQQAMVGNLDDSRRQVEAVFADIVSHMGRSSQGAETLDPALMRVFWSRLEVQNQGLIFNASRLAQALDAQTDRLRQNFNVLIAVLIVLFGTFVMLNYFFNYRRLINSIAALQNGTQILGAGNLDYSIPDKGRDEIGDLARAFNTMAGNLKVVTASKSKLEQEMEERRKVEEALKRYAQELEVANRELESFSYTVSHDLRAPLRAMDGYSSMLLEDYGDSLDEQGKTWLKNICASSEHMGQLIDDILGLSRVVRAEMKLERVDLSEVARLQAVRLQESDPERQVDFVVESGIEAVGDRNLLGLVLQNLLGNAFKFTARSAGARIEFGSMQKDGNEIFFVRDIGSGFDMQYSNQLFKAFQRLHSEKDFPGTGIGLVTVQKIVHRHGGKVWAQGEVNRGATFYFTLRNGGKATFRERGTES